jgi:type III pantothenate kinase
MILCLDVGNTQIHGGIFIDDELKFQFRKMSQHGFSSDELGVYLKGVIRENGFDPNGVKEIAFCSVVPSIIYSLKNCCQNYFNITPFVLRPGVKTGLKIKYRNPLEVGADRIANAIAATQNFPNRDLIVVDFGTATTFDVIGKDKEYLGGAILPGVKISMEVLENKTAKLPTVEIMKPEKPCGRSTVESIQSGLFHGTVGMVKELCKLLSEECFNGKAPLVIGTGGFSNLFIEENIFNDVLPNMVLSGLYCSLKLNR